MTLFSSHAYQCHHQRMRRDPHFLFTHVEEELLSRLSDTSLAPQAILNLSSFPLRFSSEESPYPTDSLPFPDDSFDLVLSCLQAHWVNDLPRLLGHILRCLRPGGVFLGALWGGQTLHELRESFLRSELSLSGGASPRVAPMLQPVHAPLLLSRAGFENPVTDTETLTVMYGSVWELMQDLRRMGETNALQERRKTFSSRGLFQRMADVYTTAFGDGQGKIPATFEVVYLTGWRAPLE